MRGCGRTGGRVGERHSASLGENMGKRRGRMGKLEEGEGRCEQERGKWGKDGNEGK